MALTDQQARALVARVDRATEAAARLKARAKDEAQDYVLAATVAVGAASVGALEGYRGKEELVAGLDADVVLAALGLGYAAFASGSKSTRDMARAFGTGALGAWSYKLAKQKAAEYARQHPAAPPAKTEGEIIGGGTVRSLYGHGHGLHSQDLAGLTGRVR